MAHLLGGHQGERIRQSEVRSVLIAEKPSDELLRVLHSEFDKADRLRNSS